MRVHVEPGQDGEGAPLSVRVAVDADFPAILRLASEVEAWFGPMVEEAGFHRALRAHIRRAAALVALSPRAGTVGGLLFDHAGGSLHIEWLVVAASARGQGVGRALLDEAVRRCEPSPAELEVVTFGVDHPGAVISGSRAFYERMGFQAAEIAAPGPEGGSRQVFRRLAPVRRSDDDGTPRADASAIAAPPE